MSKYSSDPKYVFMQSMEEADKNMSDVLYAHILEEITSFLFFKRKLSAQTGANTAGLFK